jgi:hypothetical protein
MFVLTQFGFGPFGQEFIKIVGTNGVAKLNMAGLWEWRRRTVLASWEGDA